MNQPSEITSSPCSIVSGWGSGGAQQMAACYDVSHNFQLIDWNFLADKLLPNHNWAVAVVAVIICVFLATSVKELCREHLCPRLMPIIFKNGNVGDVTVNYLLSLCLGAFYAMRVFQTVQFFDDPATLFSFVSGSTILGMCVVPFVAISGATIVIKIMAGELFKELLAGTMIVFLVGSNGAKPLGPALLVSGLVLVLFYTYVFFRRNRRQEIREMREKWDLESSKDPGSVLRAQIEKEKTKPSAIGTIFGGSQTTVHIDGEHANANYYNEEDSEVAFDMNPENSNFEFKMDRFKLKLWPGDESMFLSVVLMPIRVLLSMTVFDDQTLRAPIYIKLGLIIVGGLVLVAGFASRLSWTTWLLTGILLGAKIAVAYMFVKDFKKEKFMMRVFSTLVVFAWLNLLMALFADCSSFVFKNLEFGKVAISMFWGPLVTILPILYIMKSIAMDGLCAIGFVGGIASVNFGNLFLMMAMSVYATFVPFAEHLLRLESPRHLFTPKQAGVFLFLCIYFVGVVGFHVIALIKTHDRVSNGHAENTAIIFLIFGVMTYLVQVIT